MAVLFLICVMGISSCATYKGSRPTAVEYEIEKRIRDEYRCWKGTRYCYSGTDSGGIDCSAFVQEVYKTVFGLELPRTAKAQAKMGRAIKRQELQAGDLVFFKPPGYPYHVGIYLSGNEFTHVSKKKGVAISKLDSTYWNKYYWMSRRILPGHLSDAAR